MKKSMYALRIETNLLVVAKAIAKLEGKKTSEVIRELIGKAGENPKVQRKVMEIQNEEA